MSNISFKRALRLAAASLAFSVASESACLAADATVDVTVSPVTAGANVGCTQITIKVDPKTEAVRDVHLWLGSHTYSEPKAPAKTPPPSVTTSGDPGGYRQTPGAALPAGWTGSVTATPVTPGPATGTSTVEQNWEGPADLGAPTTFTIDYCGTKPLEKTGKPVTLTTGAAHAKLRTYIGYAVSGAPGG